MVLLETTDRGDRAKAAVKESNSETLVVVRTTAAVAVFLVLSSPLMCNYTNSREGRS